MTNKTVISDSKKTHEPTSPFKQSATKRESLSPKRELSLSPKRELSLSPKRGSSLSPKKEISFSPNSYNKGASNLLMAKNNKSKLTNKVLIELDEQTKKTKWQEKEDSYVN